MQPTSPELRFFYNNARDALRHELLTYTPKDTTVIAEAFADAIQDRKYTSYACAIMPDHVHILIRRHRDKAEAMLKELQTRSRDGLIQAGSRPATHPVWGGPGWKRYLNSRSDIERVIAYIRNNPTKAGLPAQSWAFVKDYDGWLPRPARET